MMQTVRFIKDPHGNVIATSKNDQCRIFIWIIRHWCVVKQQEKEVQASMQGDKNERFNRKCRSSYSFGINAR